MLPIRPIQEARGGPDTRNQEIVTTFDQDLTFVVSTFRDFVIKKMNTEHPTSNIEL